MHAAARAKTFAAGAAAAGIGIFAGYSLRETAGAAATVRIWDGTAAAGILLATVALTASGSEAFAPPGGVFFATGMFVEVVAGTVEGSIYIG
jgi:hypothetical protein